MAGESAVVIRELTKSFDGGKDFVLKGINLEIPKGSLTAIIGFPVQEKRDVETLVGSFQANNRFY